MFVCMHILTHNERKRKQLEGREDPPAHDGRPATALPRPSQHRLREISSEKVARLRGGLLCNAPFPLSFASPISIVYQPAFAESIIKCFATSPAVNEERLGSQSLTK